ncbi:MAG: YjjG family noncanonical pyrimidine nucleotidase [Bacteroidales bacterium]|nr:YjjG family noncanonical pyrimidine nucleotidase [Bacteroidales bacterium]
MNKYKHLFFDLDRTLWDFDRNSTETFKELFNKYRLDESDCCNFNEFLNNYREHNLRLWEMYRNGDIEKDVLSVKRFEIALGDFGITDPELVKAFAKEYLELSPLQTHLLPHTHEILTYLKPYYHLHIITNGFKEVQDVKVKKSDLEKYFEHIITSEEAGYKKPDIRIFEYTLDKTGANADECLMIGDDPESDIDGARNAGIDQVLVNHSNIQHNGGITYVIDSLKDLKSIL